MPHTLIHLVSEQTMQNLLPLLALQPQRVVQIRSRGNRFRAAANRIKAAAHEAGLAPAFEEIELSSACPGVSDVSGEIERLLAGNPDTVVNITGGTKLMSLGAFLGAAPRNAPVLYCDSEQHRFISLGQTPLGALPTFAETARKLNLRIVMEAHGVAADQWRFDTAGDAQLAFGRRAFELRFGAREVFEQYGFGKTIRAFFRGANGRIPGAMKKLLPLAEGNLTHALPDPIPREVIDFLDAASEAGFLCQLPEGGWRLTPFPGANRKKLSSHVERIANLLDGSWLELAVLESIRNSPRFAHAHWSVEPRREAGNDARGFGETDIVALSLPDGHLQLISCKTTPPRQPLEHLEAMRERSQHLGGRFAKATLALLSAEPDKVKEVKRWGELLSVRVLIGEECLTYFH